MSLYLRGKLVVLTNDLDASYASEIADMANDRLVRDMLASETFPHPFTVEDALAFFDKNRSIDNEMFAEDFIILYGGKPAGIIGISNISWRHRSAHVGYWVGRKYWNRGIASEALELIARHSAEIGLHRLYTNVLDHNLASARVLQKNGFMLEGTQKDAFMTDDGFRSMLRFARILE